MNHAVVYTDGSGMDSRFELGWPVRQKGRRPFFRDVAMGTHSVVYDAEMCTLSFAICRFKARNLNANTIYFVFDSRSVHSIFGPRPGPS